ncbi:MAG TPA: energy transducer TonB [Longimicrobiales bacterium]
MYERGAFAPPPAPADELDGYEAFTPSMVAPRLLNASEVERVLERLYPAVLRDAGIGGTVRVRLWVDETGGVVRAEIAGTSGYEAMDRAALAVVDRMRLSPALNQGRPVRVQVELPLTFRSR